MANHNQDWDELGRSIQDIVDRAVNSHDYQKLNQTISQVVEKAVDLGSEAVRKAVNGGSRGAYTTVSAASRTENVRAEKKNLPVLYGSTNGKTVGALLKTVGGGAMCSFSGLFFLGAAAMNMLVAANSAAIAVCGAILAGGAWLIGSGVNTLKRVKRFKTYRRTLGQNTHCSLEKLSRSVGKEVKYVRRDVRRMIHGGLFLQGHLDKEEANLITSDETYQYYEQSRLQLEEKKRLEAAAAKKASSHTPQVKEVLDKGNAFLAQIRKCNDDIPGEEISAKIDRMEDIVRKIFDRAETNPEIIPDLKKLMDYYLPMTVKLLNAYADMDAQPVQGETIQTSKREIEGTLDTLNLAFEKLLDDLFADTALDVSSDISVLQTLLAQEGLTQDGFSKKKQ